MPLESNKPYASPLTVPSHDRHFCTQHLHSNLKGRSIRGGVVTLVTQAIKFVLQTAQTIILARILVPEAFGLIAMVTAVTGLVLMFNDAGLSMATVQREKITHDQVSALFWFNVAISLTLTCLTAAISPLLAWAYGEPRLQGITLGLATTLLLTGVSLQHLALLRRQMRFNALAAIQIFGIMTAAGVGVVSALRGAGYWSLVYSQIGSALSTATLAWGLSGWMPGLPRRTAEVGAMLAFGGFLTGSQLLIYLRRTLDNVLIGATYGAVPLGLYQKAYGVLMLPISQVNGPISSVVLPALSRLQNDPISYRAYYRDAITIMTAIGMPIMAAAAVVPGEIVRVVLGPGWDQAVPLFIALLPAGLAGTMNVAGGWVLVSTGRTHQEFRAQAVLAAAAILSYLIGLPWGAMGVAVAFSVTFSIGLPLFFYYAFLGSPVRYRDLLESVWRPALAAVIAALCTLMVKFLLGPRESPVLSIIQLIGVFGIAYFCGWLITQKGRNYVWSIARFSFRFLMRTEKQPKELANS